MTEITVTSDRTRVVVTKTESGRAVAQDKIDPQIRSQRLRVARSMGFDETDLLTWAEAAKISGVHRATLTPEEEEAPSIVVRGIEQRREDGVKYDVDPTAFLKDVMPLLSVEQLADWKDADALCCLDIDYHDRPPPNPDWLEEIVYTKVAPTPHAWHPSRGGGLHLFYTAADPFSAKELAAIAALKFRLIDPTAGVELKTQVRGPGEKVAYVNNGYQTTASALSVGLGVDVADAEEVADWLAERNLTMGGRMDHESCPIHPTPGHKSKGDPVTISEAGLYCHNCGSQGFSLGSRRPGFAPWAAILGNPSAGDVGSMIRNLCHWGHAKYVLSYKYGMPPALARIAYAAACKAYHQEEDSFGLAHLVHGTRDTEEFTRVDTRWVAIPENYTYPPAGIKDHLASLPACQKINADGEPKVVKSTVAEFQQGKTIIDRGFPKVDVVHGFRAAAQFLPPGDVTVVPVPNRELPALAHPRYVYKTKRMSEADAWQILESFFPRLDRAFIRLAICSFGVAQETKSGMPPVVFVHGPSASGKTTTLQIAAAIYGAKVGTPTFSHDDTRLRTNIWQGAQEGPAICINEIFKDAERGSRPLSPREALDPLLNLTPDSIHHKHYHGPIRFGRVPATYFTEVTIPGFLAEETQLARRIREWPLYKKKDWKTTVPAAGGSFERLSLLRTWGKDVARACDAILSSVVDEFFAVPTTWDSMAESLGCKTLEESDNFENPNESLKEFFRLVCEAPEIGDARVAKQFATGFKKICREDTTELGKDLCGVYNRFADFMKWAEPPRRLLEKDWATLLGTDDPVHLELRTDGSSMFARFRVGPVRNPTKINEGITSDHVFRPLE